MFRFEHPELGVDDNVRIAAREEFDRAISEVSETGFEVHGTVRNVRRRLKRVRALLRLIRPVFPDYGKENAALREMGAAFSGLRDAMARVEAVDALKTYGGAEIEAPLERLRRDLVMRAAAHEAELDREIFLTTLRRDLRDARVRAELWSLSGAGRKAVVPGLVDTYRQARKELDRAKRRGDEDSLHEWRKAVKRHAAQLSLLAPLSPPFAAGRGRGAKKLARVLGDLTNLNVLRRTIEDDSGGIDEEDKVRIDTCLADATARQRAKALKLGRLLFADTAKTVRRRWSVYWDDWRAGRRLN